MWVDYKPVDVEIDDNAILATQSSTQRKHVANMLKCSLYMEQVLFFFFSRTRTYKI